MLSPVELSSNEIGQRHKGRKGHIGMASGSAMGIERKDLIGREK
jgi:hypothetical protein